MQPQGQGRTSSGKWFQRQDLLNFINTLYEGDLHAKRVLSLANATLGVLTSASLAIHAAGRGLAQAMGTLTKHGVKQVDRLLSNRGIDVWTFFAYWTPYVIGARSEVVVALERNSERSPCSGVFRRPSLRPRRQGCADAGGGSG